MFFERLGKMGPKLFYCALTVSLLFISSCVESTSSEISTESAYYTQQPQEAWEENLICSDVPTEQKDPVYIICDPFYPNPYNGPSIDLSYAAPRSGSMKMLYCSPFSTAPSPSIKKAKWSREP